MSRGGEAGNILAEASDGRTRRHALTERVVNAPKRRRRTGKMIPTNHGRTYPTGKNCLRIDSPPLWPRRKLVLAAARGNGNTAGADCRLDRVSGI